jgi:hypothetical protein
VALPRTGLGPAPTIVAVYTPEEVTIAEEFASLEPAGMARIDLARADWLAASIGELVRRIDRSSGRDHERLVSLLVNHEMALRSAERNVGQIARGSTRADVDGDRADPRAIQAARTSVIETTRRAGLEADLASVQSYLGESPRGLTGPLVGIPEPSISDRIRLFGYPFALIGVMPGVDDPSSRTPLTLETRSWLARRNQLPGRLVITLALLFGIALLATGLVRGLWSTALALSMALGVAWVTGGPLLGAGALAMAAAGWKTVRS